MRRTPYAVTLMMFLWSGIFASSNWPNEQTGSTMLCDWPFDSITGTRYGAPSGGGGQIIADASAPFSPANVWRNSRNATSRNAGEVKTIMPSEYRDEVFFGFWFKPSDPHFGWFNGWYQKIAMVNGRAPHIYIKMQGDLKTGKFFIVGGPEKQVGVKDWENAHLVASDGALYANVSNPQYSVGQWYRIEIYCKRSTTSSSQDGVFKWWVNGVLNGNFTTVNFAEPIRELVLTNVWDSEYPDLPFEEYVQYDHMYVSLPPGVVKSLAIATDALPAGSSGTKYPTTVITAKGGMPPYKLSLESGTLPAGMNFYPATGYLSGTPTEGGTKSLVFKVTDAFKATATKTLSLVIKGQSAISAGGARTQSCNMSIEAKAASGRVGFNLQFANVEGRFKLGVYDLHGRNVWTYSAAVKGKSVQAVWNHANRLSKGVYLIRVEQSGKMMNTNYCHVW